MPAGFEQGIGQALTLRRLEQCSRQPQGLVAVEIGSDLLLVAAPPGVGGRHVRAIIGNHGGIVVLTAPGRVPPVACQRAERGCMAACGELQRLRRIAGPLEEGLPDPRHGGGVQPLADERNVQGIVGLDLHALAPVRVVEAVAVQIHETPQQPPEGSVRIGPYRGERSPGEVRQLMRLQGDLGDDAETATATALQSPEQLRVAHGIDGAQLAVSGNDFGFEQTAGCRAIALRERSEAAALDVSCHANRGTPATLDVAPALGRHGIVGVHPHRAGFNRDRRGWGDIAVSGHETLVKLDLTHRARPDQQRIGSVGSALITVSAAFHDEAQIVLAREVDCRHHIGAGVGDDGVLARCRRPGVEPA